MRARPLLLAAPLLLGVVPRVGSSAPLPVKAIVASAPAGPASPALAARLDASTKKLFVRACPALPCEPTTSSDVPLADPIDPSASSIDVVDLGAGKRVLRVIARSAKRPLVAWEAIVVGRAKSEAELVWSGLTGFGAEGEGEGRRVLLDGNALYVGKLRREITLCGQNETLLEPQWLEPKSLTLRRVAMHRLPKAVRDAAPTLLAQPAEAPPIGSIADVRGASNHDGASTALVDDDPSTAWTETLKGDGKGEFVVFRTPSTLPIERLSLVVRPSKPIAGFAQPVSLWLTTDAATYRIAIPASDAPGARVDVLLPKPIATTCLALSIDRAEEEGDVVGLAEVDAVPVFPSTIHSLDDLVTFLDASGGNLELATKVLATAGARGAKAIAAKIGALGDRGKERAIDVLEAQPCEAAAGPLARLAWDAPRKTADAARKALDGCGVAAKDAIATAYHEGPDAAREVLAERYAKLDPKRALAAILETVKTAPASRRRTFRIALGRVAATTNGREAIAAWLASPAAASFPSMGENDVAIELARSIAKVPELAEATASGPILPLLSKVLLAHADPSRPFEARWLAAQPIADLAARGDLASLAWLRALFATNDRYLRARAVDVSGDVDALRPEVLAALKDNDPRVRQTALVALRRGAGPTGATPAAIALLHDDGWTYVRVAAAETLGESTGGGDVDVALGKATTDPARAVRGAAIRALVARHARSQLPSVRARAFDNDEAIDVRRDALEALGKLCDVQSADDLFEIAKKSGESEGSRQLQLSAIVALGDLHPKDLSQRLAAIDATSLVVKDAIRRALKNPGVCKP